MGPLTEGTPFVNRLVSSLEQAISSWLATGDIGCDHGVIGLPERV